MHKDGILEGFEAIKDERSVGLYHDLLFLGRCRGIVEHNLVLIVGSQRVEGPVHSEERRTSHRVENKQGRAMSGFALSAKRDSCSLCPRAIFLVEMEQERG